MKFNIFAKKYIIVALLLVLFLPTSHTLQAQGMPPSPVVVSKVEEHKIQKPVTLVGTVEPRHRSLVASEIAGLVEEFPVEEGDFIKQGEVLAKFITDRLQIQLREARAQKKEAQARYKLARSDLLRFKELEKKGVVSISQLQDTQAEEGAWSERVSQLKANIEKYEYDLKRAKIVAPFTGYITKEHTEVGQWIEEGGSVVEMVDLEQVHVTVQVPEYHIGQIKVGDTASTTFDALPQLTEEGKTISIVPQADKEARTFPVKVEIENKDHVIKAGMLARVSFLLGEPTSTKLVSKDAIVEQNNLNFVYVVNDGTVRPVQVTTGVAYRDLIEVIGPIEAGELVVVRGNERLRPGQPIRVVDTLDAADTKIKKDKKL